MRPLTRNCQALNSQYRAPLRGTAENRPDLRLASKDRSAENAPNVLADLDVTAQTQRVYRWALAALGQFPPVTLNTRGRSFSRSRLGDRPRR